MVAAAALAGGLIAGGPAVAQQAPQQQSQEQRPQSQQQGQQQSARQDQGGAVTVLSGWDYRGLYESGWSAQRIMDADVYGQNGEDIGDIENILVSW